MMGPNAPEAPLLVEISDPVANVSYTLDTQNKIAHRVQYSDTPARQAGGAAVGSRGGGRGAAGGTIGLTAQMLAAPPPLPAEQRRQPRRRARPAPTVPDPKCSAKTWAAS